MGIFTWLFGDDDDRYDDLAEDGKYNDAEASRDTGVSHGEVRGAWHNANNDAIGTKYEGRSEMKDHVDNKRG